MATPWDPRPLTPPSGGADGEAGQRARSEGSRQSLKLLLVATRQHLASPDVRTLVSTLQAEDSGFEISLEVADPANHPELLELH
ncbi:MAG: circadian clock KaiB family protein, partial [Cyanobium sp.]